MLFHILKVDSFSESESCKKNIFSTKYLYNIYIIYKKKTCLVDFLLKDLKY